MRDAAKITVEDYKRAFLALDSKGRISDNQITMLKTHCQASDQVTTAQQLPKVVSYKGCRSANLQYGILAKRVAKEVGYQPPKGYTFLSTLVTFPQEHVPYKMKLRPNVIEALEEIGWCNG